MIINLLIALLVVLGAYFIAMGGFAEGLSPARQRRHLLFFFLGVLAGLTVFIPAPDLFGPDHRFTVSMAQMLFAIDIVPLFLSLGIPEAMFRTFERLGPLLRSVARPQVAGIISTVILLGWFVPPVFEAASRNLPLWVFKQLTLIVCGAIFWWPVMGLFSAWKPNYLVQIVYLFVMRIPMTIFGVIFTFADKLIYSSRSFSLEICAPSSISDQQAGGLVMWTVGGLIAFIVFSFIFFNFFSAYDAEGA